MRIRSLPSPISLSSGIDISPTILDTPYLFVMSTSPDMSHGGAPYHLYSGLFLPHESEIECEKRTECIAIIDLLSNEGTSHSFRFMNHAHNLFPGFKYWKGLYLTSSSKQMCVNCSLYRGHANIVDAIQPQSEVRLIIATPIGSPGTVSSRRSWLVS